MVDEDYLGRLRLPLAALMRWLDESAIHGAVVGGVAASLRGKPRLTKDIDAVILDVSAEMLIESGPQHGFTARIGEAAEFAHANRVLLLR